jgi:hypothetical protein
MSLSGILDLPATVTIGNDPLLSDRRCRCCPGSAQILTVVL